MQIKESPQAYNHQGIDSKYAWFRLCISLLLMIIGGSGMYMAIIVLPELQQEFGVARADASMPYTLTMIGFGVGGVLMGRLADRYGIWLPIVLGGSCLGAGFLLGGGAASLWYFSLVQGLLVGMLGSSSSFAPLMADTSLWFLKRRGIAVGIVASGNYMAGAIWPPLVRHWVDLYGWRDTMMGVGIFCVMTMLPLALLLRRRAPGHAPVEAGMDARQATATASSTHSPEQSLGISARALLALLCIAGVSCCIAMAMPQVHIVAYCTDLGFGAVKGAQMLSAMLAAGVISRLIFGVISDRIGGLRTLLLGSVLQGLALLLFIPFQDLSSLFIVSALFGLFQGGIVPAYAIIIREYFPPQVAATRVGIVIMFTLGGMALGGWMSGWIFDVSGSYEAAFINGIAWNLVNLLIVLGLLYRQRKMKQRFVTANHAA
ncbi:MAG: MFS transporter [Betaproteobacteria bacterium]|jgi:MFS family permease|nr:MFS transporter [Pseudomonadota bacterium]NBO94427.1 MFS transporter [Betaproteobacteria bacterium]NBP34243.1 MFS transporter [Betaproteobacteria bacterium]NBP38310.1 MFS transporter [Betaproteobacteria bacterium]NBQ77330.1 MFS transporter [Betaproteobacteria bacterium]